MTASPVGVSVLFTDLVGSTALAARVGAEEAERLRTRYFELQREPISTHGGTEVKSTGDGVMAVFSGVSGALDSAVAIQQALDQHNRSGDERLEVRVGLATGDCVPADDDYYGEAVVQAARLCDRADAGQILTTAVIGMLATRGSYELEQVGELDLKGLPEPVAALELAWSPLTAAPPLPLQERLTIEQGTRFVGRDEERAVLTGALADAAGGERRVVLLTGEAGLGKTRLATDFACTAHAEGTLVLYGRCEENLATPYRPWSELLCHLVEHGGDGLLAPLGRSSVADLARIVPPLRERADEEPEDTEAAGDQYALFAAIATLLAAVANDQTVVLVLDDLHWADQESVALLSHVVAELPSARMLIVGTYRQTDLEADDALTRASAQLHREVGVERLAMRGLADQEVVALLEAVAGHALDDEGRSLAHSLWAETSGSPFFAIEMLRHLAESGSIVQDEEGRWTSAVDLRTIELPQSVRDVVGQRIQRLGDEARRVLSAAAVIGREFDLVVLAGALDTGQDEALDVLERAMEAGLVAEVGAADRFTFTHALVQHTLYDELSASRRARLHRRVAEAIESVVGDDPGARVGELANHWFAAVQPSDRDRAIGYARAAGERALELRAPEEAVRWYTQALDAAPDEGRLRAEMLVKLGDAERQAGHARHRERLLEAARLAERLGADDLLVAAAIHNFRGWFSSVGEVDVEKVAVLEAAIDHAGPADSRERARLLATLAGELAYSGQARRFEIGSDAVEIASRIGDPVVMLDVIQRLGTSLSVPELYPERATRAAEAMRLSADHGDRVKRFFALEAQIDVEMATAEIQGARRCDAERAAIAAELRQPTLRWFATNGTALLDLIEGDTDAAERRATEAHEIGNESGQPDATMVYGGLLVQIRWQQGRGGELIPLLQQLIAGKPGMPVFRSMLTIFLVHEGEREAAEAVLDELGEDDFDFPIDLLWLTSSVLAAEAVSALGHRAGAEILYERLLPSAESVAASRASCVGPVAHYLGLLATTLGRDAEAEAHFEAALERSTRMHSPFHRARTMLATARLLGERSPERARQLAAEAAELADRHGMAQLSKDVTAVTSPTAG